MTSTKKIQEALVERRFLSVDDITVVDRMRELDLGWVEALADDISEKGQLQPIGVRKTDVGFVLVFGEHRLAAQKLRGSPSIEVCVLHVTEAQAKVIEIDENILRMPFSPLSFARSLAKRKAVYEEAYPLAKHGAKGLIAANTPDENGPQSPSGNDCHLVEGAQSFSENTAEKLGVSTRKIRLAIWLHKNFDAVAEILLKDHPIMDNAAQLHTLARLEPADQERAAKLIVDGTCKNANEATAFILNKVQPSPSQKVFGKLVDHWERSDMGVKRSFLDQMANTALPSGYRIITPEGPNG